MVPPRLGEAPGIHALAGESVDQLPEGWAYDVGSAGHVFLNGDLDLARDAVNYLQTGTPPR